VTFVMWNKWRNSVIENFPTIKRCPYVTHPLNGYALFTQHTCWGEIVRCRVEMKWTFTILPTHHLRTPGELGSLSWRALKSIPSRTVRIHFPTECEISIVIGRNEPLPRPNILPK
jgi:hypothetical protein